MKLTDIVEITKDMNDYLSTQLSNLTIPNGLKVFNFNQQFEPEQDVFKLSFAIADYANLLILKPLDGYDELENIASKQIKDIGEENVILRYDIFFHLKAADGYEFKAFGFEFNASQSIMLSFYKIHQESETLENALFQDISSFKLIYSSDEILSLCINEGAAVQFKGKINSMLNVSVSDVFSGTLTQIANNISRGSNICGIIKSGTSLSFKVEINDNFKVFIQRKDKQFFWVTINKAKSNLSAGTISMGVEVQLKEDDDALNNLANSILSSLLGESVNNVNDYIENKLGNLNDFDKDLLSKILKNIGIEIDLNVEAQVKKEYDNYKSRIIEKVKEVLEQKIKVGLSFDYSRINSSNRLFKAEFSEEAIKENLRSILMLKTSDLENKKGINISQYLLSNSESISRKFGFALQFGNLHAYWRIASEIKTDDYIDLINNKKSVAFSGQTNIESELNNKRKRFIQFRAQTTEPKETITMSDFNYSTTLYWEDQERKTKLDELSDIIEIGAIWRCFPKSEFDYICSWVFSQIKDQKDVKFSCTINIPFQVMNMLIPQLANPETELRGTIVHSLTDAMPFLSNQYRKKLPELYDAYNSIWNSYLKQKISPGSGITWASVCYKKLQFIDKKLADWEGQFKSLSITNDQGYQSFVGLIENNYIGKKIENLSSAMKGLLLAIYNKTPYSRKLMEDIFQRSDDLILSYGTNKLFNIKFLGRYLLNTAENLKLLNDIESFMAIEYLNGNGEPEVITFTMKKC